MRIIRYEYELLPVQGGGIEFSHPPLPSFEVEGVKILLPHPVI